MVFSMGRLKKFPAEVSISMSGTAGITAAILVGGLGTRLRPAVADRPKVLAAVAGRPFLTYLLDQLARAGIRSTVLCTGYRADVVATELGSSYKGMALIHSRESSPLGTGGALRHARALLQSDPVLVLNGDSYCDADLGFFIDRHRKAEAVASLLLTEMSQTSRYGRVEVNDRETVVGFIEKAQGSGPGWINAGIYVLAQSFLQSLPLGTPLSLEREVFPAWVGRGLNAFRSPGWFIDIGTPESYVEAGRLFESRCLA